MWSTIPGERLRKKENLHQDCRYPGLHSNQATVEWVAAWDNLLSTHCNPSPNDSTACAKLSLFWGRRRCSADMVSAKIFKKYVKPLNKTEEPNHWQKMTDNETLTPSTIHKQNAKVQEFTKYGNSSKILFAPVFLLHRPVLFLC
jgi:hypothetical protein